MIGGESPLPSGSRPKRGQHNALDALYMALTVLLFSDRLLDKKRGSGGWNPKNAEVTRGRITSYGETVFTGRNITKSQHKQY
ncbi:hypothetical protein MNBD_GAMMA26-2663 [hydrothermal vent metagenome]|uniref:Uncharacterized protein n=1 Tax=hydrothermal vent metagenome TaxID=652676 RepID=A0A3B1BIU1_9ZZZZ